MIEGISANDTIFGQATGPTQDLDKSAFMELLVAQMRNQDPMEPTSNDQFIAQLAQFSSLEEMQAVNENIVGLAVLQQSNALMSQLTDSSALIGMTVEYQDPVSGEPAVGQVASVKIEEGIAVLRIEGQDVPLASVSAVLGSEPPAGDGGDGEGDGTNEGDGE
jgi:flagellar basal-body rod modification protein FlgD